MKLSEKIQEALREQQEINLSDPAVQKRLAAQWGYVPAGAQPAPSAVAYLDLGVGGYMDIGTDLTDEELDAIPKGRHMLGIVGTYGVEGYVPAQPAPSVPDGFAWPECPKRRQSNVLFDDGYEEGWAACVATIKAALASPEAKP